MKPAGADALATVMPVKLVVLTKIIMARAMSYGSVSERECKAVLDECLSYNDELRKNGHLVAEEPLQSPNTAVSVVWKNGRFSDKRFVCGNEAVIEWNAGA